MKYKKIFLGLYIIFFGLLSAVLIESAHKTSKYVKNSGYAEGSLIAKRQIGNLRRPQTQAVYEYTVKGVKYNIRLIKGEKYFGVVASVPSKIYLAYDISNPLTRIEVNKNETLEERRNKILILTFVVISVGIIGSILISRLFQTKTSI